MSKTKFTPGPWRVDTYYPIPHVIASCYPDGATCVAVVYGDGDSGGIMARVPPPNDEAANAHLIAAAPDLYAEVAAMRELDEHIGSCPRCDATDAICPDALRMLLSPYDSRLAAYRKARGEA